MDLQHSAGESASDFSNVIPLHSRKDKLTPAEKFESMAALQRLGTLVSPLQFQILFFIWMRQVYWGKADAYITFKQFLEKGVVNREGGEMIIAPLQIKERALRENLAALMRAGYVLREMRGGKGGYPFYKLNLEAGYKMLRQPKEKKTKEKVTLRQPKREGGRGGAGGRGAEMPPTNYENTNYEKNLNRQLKPPAVRDDSLSGSIATAQQRTRAKRADKMQHARRSETVAGLALIWQAAIKQAYPEYKALAFTKAECGMIAKFRDKMKKQDAKFKTADFIEFAAAEWARVIALNFKHAKQPAPAYPEMSFLINRQRAFLAAYYDAEFNSKQLNSTQREREITKLRRMGYTEAQAEKAYLESLEETQYIKRVGDKLEMAEMQKRALAEKTKRLEKENQELRIREGRRLKGEMNRGSDDTDAAVKGVRARMQKKSLKDTDADGFAPFDAQPLGDWEE